MQIQNPSHFTTSAKSSASSRCARKKRRCPVASELSTVTELAVQLHALSLQTTEGVSPIDDKLERLSLKFDRAHAKARNLGVPLGQAFRVDLAGQGYVVTLAENGLEYSPLS